MIRNCEINWDVWIDPLKTPYSIRLSVEKGRKINAKLNKLLNQNCDFQMERIKKVRFQENTYDCGPMICFYANQFIQGESLLDSSFSIHELRTMIHCIQNGESKLSGGGRKGEACIDERAEALNLAIDYHFRHHKRILIINSEISGSMLLMDKKILAKKVKLTSFNDIDYVACLFTDINDMILFIYKYREQVSRLINLTKNNYNEHLIEIGERLTSLVNAFTLDGKCKLDTKENKEFENQQIEFESVAAICNKEFQTKIKANKAIAEAIAEIKPRQIEEKKHELARNMNSRLNELDIENFFNDCKTNDDQVFLNIALTKSIIEEDWTHVISWSNVEALKRAKTMYCLLPHFGKYTTLAIIDFNAWEYYIFDPRCREPNDRLLQVTHHLAENIARFCLLKGGTLTHNKCPYLAKGSGLYNHILLCGYIKGFMHDEDLDIDNLGKMAEQLSTFIDIRMKKRKKEYAENEIEDEELTKMRRITKSKLLMQKHLNDDAETIYKVIVDNIPITRFPGKIDRKPYLGKRKLFELPDKVILQANFRKCIGKTVNKIISCAENVCEQPSIRDIENAYRQVSPADFDPTLLEVCGQINGTLELIEIRGEEVVHKLKTLKNSTPGPDGIRYNELRLLDTEGRLLK